MWASAIRCSMADSVPLHAPNCPCLCKSFNSRYFFSQVVKATAFLAASPAKSSRNFEFPHRY